MYYKKNAYNNLMLTKVKNIFSGQRTLASSKMTFISCMHVLVDTVGNKEIKGEVPSKHLVNVFRELLEQ